MYILRWKNGACDRNGEKGSERASSY